MEHPVVASRFNCMPLSALIKIWLGFILFTAFSALFFCIFLLQNNDSHSLLVRRFVLNIEDELAGELCQNIYLPRLKALNASKEIDTNEFFSYIPFVYRGNKWKEFVNETSVCLATHTTADRMHWLEQQASLWGGMISVSVFVPGDDSVVAQAMIEVLRNCSEAIRNNVSFQFVYNVLNYPSTKRIKLPNIDLCKDIKLVNSALMKCKQQINEDIASEYPQNLMRNVARRTCLTTHTLNVDVDMIVNKNLSCELDKFLGCTSLCKKCAYIIPVYEIKETSSFPPENKKVLISYLKNKQAQRFHDKVYARNQGNSNLLIWEAAVPNETTTEVAVLYDIRKYVEYWEPIVVIHSSAPNFDERFIGYGYTRNSHILHLKSNNFTFQMLNTPFLSHSGFQTRSSYTKSRSRQAMRNFKLYRQFKKELLGNKSINLIPKTNKFMKSKNYRWFKKHNKPNS